MVRQFIVKEQMICMARKHIKPHKRIMLIVNPKAGKMRSKFAVSDIAELFAKNEFEVAIYFTSLEYGAEYLVKEHAKEFDIIACCGGDGTVNEIIKGMMDIKDCPPLGYIPSGTTNDLATSLGMTTNIKKAAKAIISDDGLPFDVGSFDDDYFAYIASFGAFTEVSYNTSQRLKNIWGHAAYVFSAMKCMHRLKSYHIRVESEEKTVEGDYVFGAVTNSTSVAGVFKFERDKVDFADGKYEVLLIKHPKKLSTAIAISMSMLNKSFKNENITFFHASDIKITSDEPLDWALDGEHKRGENVVNIKNNYRAIKIIRKRM